MEASALTTHGSISGLRGPSPLLRLQSDERLIALTRRGQHAAFEVLFARYQTRLLAFCRHMLGSREDAEDVLQEVFASAFNAVLADQRHINVRPWLYRIARNRSLNHLRRASAVGVDSMDVHFADGGISTSDKVLRRESFRELIDDVHTLPETQRTALLLREIDALSYEQIAHAMETTVPSVKSLLVRARISLAEAAEARKLSCQDVRLELGEAAEGLLKISTPVRRHLRSCQRCSAFRKQLRHNNRALAVVMPVAPLLIAKKLLLAKLGSTASAGGATVASSASAGAGAGAGAGASAGAAGIGAGAAAGGSSLSGVVTAGAGALATKAVAGLAAAAIVTAGAVAADHAATTPRHHQPLATAASGQAARSSYQAPVVVHQSLQPVSASNNPPAARRRARRHRPTQLLARTAAPAAAPVSASATAPATPQPQPADAPAVTEVTSQTTELPAAATSVPTTSVNAAAPAVDDAPASTATATAAPSSEPAADGDPASEPSTTPSSPPPSSLATQPEAQEQYAAGGESPEGTSPAESEDHTGSPTGAGAQSGVDGSVTPGLGGAGAQSGVDSGGTQATAGAGIAAGEAAAPDRIVLRVGRRQGGAYPRSRHRL
ncbi:MAG TPA: RNA polymerase sigma factor [Solirubrobacteraceae bacterium]|nr:RNA polymerase sigma factor [Solirubrobacteraceae bacterium]